MKWSWKIAEFSGIPVYIHATFMLIIAWVVLTHGMCGLGLSHVIGGVMFVLAIFACVVLHEFGHALAARRFGIRTRDITLLPIGGVARLERMPEKPRQELWVAIAGPLVNVGIAAFLAVWLIVSNTFEPLGSLSIAGGPFVERLMVINIFLVLFNLLPAFPMDGGRVLRALLASRMSYPRATQLAATTGQGMALLFGFLGLFFNPFLILIALFVWIGAAQEASQVQAKSALGGIPVRAAMVTDFRQLSPADTLQDVIGLILSGYQEDFPVVDNGAVVGVLTRPALLRALASRNTELTVGQIMDTGIETVQAGEMLEGVFNRLQTCQCNILPVLDRGRLVGLVTPENLGEFLAISSALSAGSVDGPFKRRLANARLLGGTQTG